MVLGCRVGTKTTARNAMAGKCAFEMVDKKEPYSASIVTIVDPVSGGRRKATRKNRRRGSRKNRKASRRGSRRN